VRVFEDARQTPVMVMGELSQPTSTSVTTMAKYLAPELIQRHVPQRFEALSSAIFLEHDVEERMSAGRLGRKPTWDRDEGWSAVTVRPASYVPPWSGRAWIIYIDAVLFLFCDVLARMFRRERGRPASQPVLVRHGATCVSGSDDVTARQPRIPHE
jgi:hypothetical protein